MKPVYSGWSVLAFVVGASLMPACSSDAGGSTTSEPSTGPTPRSVDVSTPDTPSRGGADHAPASGASPTAPSDVVPVATPPSISNPDVSAPIVPRDPATDEPGASPAPTTLLLSVVQGTVTDGGSGSISVGLGGKGALSAAATIHVSQIVSGKLNVVAVAAVDGAGKFSVKVPIGLDTLIAQAIDVSGHLLGSVIVGASGKVAGDIVIAAPITTETSLEVDVLLDACGCPMGKSGKSGLHADLSLAVDVSALIDAKLTAAVTAAVAAGVDVDVLVHALASAVVASARARADVFLDAGAKLDADAAVKADIDALVHLNAGLTDVLSGKATVADVTAKLLADLDVALSATVDVSASVRARAQVAASLTLCATLAASLVGVAHVDAVVFAATHAAAQIEASLTTKAVADILKLTGAAQGIIDAAVAAGDLLVANVGAATNIDALKQARLDFVSTLTGGLTGSGGLLGDLLKQTTGTVTTLLGSTLDVVAKLTADLDATLKADLAAMVKADICVDLEASAKLDVTISAVVSALAKFATDVQALGPSLQLGTTAQVSAKALTDLLATVQVLLRVS